MLGCDFLLLEFFFLFSRLFFISFFFVFHNFYFRRFIYCSFFSIFNFFTMLCYRFRFFIATAYYSCFTRSFSYRCSFNRRDRCCRIFCTRYYSFLSYWCFNILCSCWNWCSITNCCTYLIGLLRATGFLELQLE